jgi:amidase
MRRLIMAIGATLLALPAQAKPVDLTRLNANQLQAEFSAGRTTSAAVVTAALARIEALNRRGPKLNAVIVVNPMALADARALDAERLAGRLRGPLHGVPILIKDNIDTLGMATTAGSLALKDNMTGRDAPLVAKLRAAGAVILGKTNMSEWANFRSSRSMSGWSAVGGIVRNPYALDRTACGSSSGSGAAVAARMAPLAIGTETDGSVVCPASINGLVGVKPTVGLVSRTHVVPISATQDTAGPMTRNVLDAATLLAAIAGTDPNDPATADADARKHDYAKDLKEGLKGVRIGVLRDRVGEQPGITVAFEAALVRLKAKGAVLVEIVESGFDPKAGEAEGIVLRSEFLAGLNAYLATTPPQVKTRTLAEIVKFNTANAASEMPYFAQELFIESLAAKPLNDPAYQKALAASVRLSGPEGIDRLLKANNVSMLIQPTEGAAWPIDPVYGDQSSGPSASGPAARAGYPHVSVPMGQVLGLPVGLSFIAAKWNEQALLDAAFGFEQSGPPLPAPVFPPAVKAAMDPAPR